MAAALGYLTNRPNGRYSIRFQRPSARWKQESLGTSKAAEAKIKFDLWKQERLQKRLAGFHDVDAVPLKRLAEEHLANVRRHQAKSWDESSSATCTRRKGTGPTRRRKSSNGSGPRGFQPKSRRTRSAITSTT